MRVTGESSGGEAARLSGGLARLKGLIEKAKSELQRLKPLGLRADYVVAKATTHKDSRALTHALRCPPSGSPLQIEMPRIGETLALSKTTANRPQRLPGSVNLGGPLKPNERGG